MVVSLASAGGAAKIYCVNGGGQSNKNAAAWLEAKVGQTKKRRNGGQGGSGGDGEIRLIQVSLWCFEETAKVGEDANEVHRRANQDFDFPEASNKIKTTRDGQYVMATGTYKPRFKVFDLEELSLKTERVTDSENVDFCVSVNDRREAKEEGEG